MGNRERTKVNQTDWRGYFAIMQKHRLLQSIVHLLLPRVYIEAESRCRENFTDFDIATN